MEIQFLGTSSGTPTKTRNLSGLALRSLQSSHWCLVDCGEGTQHRILHTSLSLPSLRAVFITHVHGDHCYGLPGLLASAGMQGRTEPVTIAGPSSVHDFVRAVMDTTELRLPYRLEFVDAAHIANTAILPDFDVGTTALSHRVPSYAYSFTEKVAGNTLDAARLAREGVAPGPAWGRIQRGIDVVLPGGRCLRARDYLRAPRKPRKIIVGGDNDRPELLMTEAQGADVLVHEATYTEAILEKIGPAPQHSSARRVARFAADAGIANLVLTHFSPRYQEQGGEQGTLLTLADIEAEARAAYQGRLFLARDLERYSLDRRGSLERAAP